MTNRMTSVLRDLWRTSTPLTAVGLLMLAALVPFAAGIWLDPRIVGGAPAWLKPAKFAASTAIYSLTLAWLFRYLGAWRQTRRVVGWTTAVVFVLEVAAIAMQAWRGTTSHFNVGTAFDAAVFSVMGTAIFVQTAASLAVAVALWRERFADPALGWALRLGMALTIVGASTGGLMVRPTEAQLADARAGHGMPIAGAHTVGAPDGGAGLPGTGWSVEHGDLRVPHFVGSARRPVAGSVCAVGRGRLDPGRVAPRPSRVLDRRVELHRAVCPLVVAGASCAVDHAARRDHARRAGRVVDGDSGGLYAAARSESLRRGRRWFTEVVMSPEQLFSVAQHDGARILAAARHLSAASADHADHRRRRSSRVFRGRLHRHDCQRVGRQ